MAHRVLIIDDDVIMRVAVRKILEADGYEVFEGVDGPDGLRQAAVQRPDVIILDLAMPGMDGYAVCRTLKAQARTSAIPVIFMTASTDRLLNQQAYAAGASACLPKPFRREGLLATVVLCLQHGRSPAAASGTIGRASW